MTALLIILIVLVLTTWLYAMYLAWRKEMGKEFPLVGGAPIIATWDKSSRLTRRGWYGIRAHLREWSARLGESAQRAFVKAFPTSAPVFEKKDKLTGLTHGPSSYYLKSITPSKETPSAGSGRVPKRLPRTKKPGIVAAPIDQSPMESDQMPE